MQEPVMAPATPKNLKGGLIAVMVRNEALGGGAALDLAGGRPREPSRKNAC
jgi:hypothetical protein